MAEVGPSVLSGCATTFIGTLPLGMLNHPGPRSNACRLITATPSPIVYTPTTITLRTPPLLNPASFSRSFSLCQERDFPRVFSDVLQHHRLCDHPRSRVMPGRSEVPGCSPTHQGTHWQKPLTHHFINRTPPSIIDSASRLEQRIAASTTIQRHWGLRFLSHLTLSHLATTCLMRFDLRDGMYW